MIAIEAASADSAWRQAARLLQDQSKIQSGRDQPTRELLHVIFSIADSRQRVVFARPLNPAFAVAEVVGILSGSNASEFFVSWNSRMRRFVDNDASVFYGAYGHRLGSRPRLSPQANRCFRIYNGDDPSALDQVRFAYEALRYSPDSRQVVLQIWDAARDLPNPSSRSADIPCNLASHLMIRDGRLEWLQVMRSNDLIWGTPINFVQFTYLQEIMAGWLGVNVGSYVHVSDSLHVYQRHWDELDRLDMRQDEAIPTNRTDLRIEGYKEWEDVWELVADVVLDLTKVVTPDLVSGVMNRSDDLPAGYREWIALLAAESLRRSNFDVEAGRIIDRAGEYWATSWRRWHRRKSLPQPSNCPGAQSK